MLKLTMASLGNGFPKQDGARASLAVFIYCLAFMALRLAMSPTLQLDEAEQFLRGSQYSLITGWQPPLYSWLVHTFSLAFGLNLFSIVLVKYILIFFFYLCFYRICIRFWTHHESLVVTASLMLLTDYSYEFNRDLSHTVLVSMMAALTMLIFIKLLESKETRYYILLGAVAGLGMISKYNYAFILGALLLAALSSGDSRRMLFDRRIFITLILTALIMTPHFTALYDRDFFTLTRALEKSKAGGAGLAGVLLEDVSAYATVIVFLVVFAIFFRPWRHSFVPWGRLSSTGRFFRMAALFGMALPILTSIIIHAGRFKGRWLAPVLITVPLGLFTAVNIDSNGRRTRAFLYLCFSIIAAVFLVRAAAGFLPDLKGNPDEIHIPFSAISQKLEDGLRANGISDISRFPVISESDFLCANLLQYIPFKGYHIFRPNMIINERAIAGIRKTGAVLVWDIKKEGEDVPPYLGDYFQNITPVGIVSAKYLHFNADLKYRLGAAVVRPEGQPLKSRIPMPLPG